jgi:DNA repair exonuclease SbcCD nuclease subunit
MIIPIISDIHVHNWREFSKLDSDGVPTRLKDTLKPFQELRAYMKRNDLTTAFCAGDVFHKRNVIQTQSFNLAFNTVARFAQENLDLYMIPGNHDQTTKDGQLHSLQPMAEVAAVFSNPIEKDFGDTTVVFMPFLDDAQATKDFLSRLQRPKKAKRFILLGHLGVNGAKAGPYEYKPLEQVSASDFPSCLDAVLLGHYHDRQVLQKAGNGKPLVRYIGAPLQHSREDEGSERGIMLFDTDTLKSSFLNLDLPKFVTVKASEIPQSNNAPPNLALTGNFVTVDLDVDLKQKAVDRLNGNAAGWITRKIEVAAVAAPRSAVAPSMKQEDILKEYLTANPDDDLDDDMLIKLGLELLSDEV